MEYIVCHFTISQWYTKSESLDKFKIKLETYLFQQAYIYICLVNIDLQNIYWFLFNSHDITSIFLVKTKQHLQEDQVNAWACIKASLWVQRDIKFGSHLIHNNKWFTMLLFIDT